MRRRGRIIITIIIRRALSRIEQSLFAIAMNQSFFVIHQFPVLIKSGVTNVAKETRFVGVVGVSCGGVRGGIITGRSTSCLSTRACEKITTKKGKIWLKIYCHRIEFANDRENSKESERE